MLVELTAPLTGAILDTLRWASLPDHLKPWKATFLVDFKEQTPRNSKAPAHREKADKACLLLSVPASGALLPMSYSSSSCPLQPWDGQSSSSSSGFLHHGESNARSRSATRPLSLSSKKEAAVLRRRRPGEFKLGNSPLWLPVDCKSEETHLWLKEPKAPQTQPDRLPPSVEGSIYKHNNVHNVETLKQTNKNKNRSEGGRKRRWEGWERECFKNSSHLLYSLVRLPRRGAKVLCINVHKLPRL